MDQADSKASSEKPALKVGPWSVPLAPRDALGRQVNKAWPERQVLEEIQQPDPKAQLAALGMPARKVRLDRWVHQAEFRKV